MRSVWAFAVVALGAGSASGQESRELAVGQADAVVDLRTQAGIDLLRAEWRSVDAQLVKEGFRAPGPSKSDPLALYPTGRELQTLNVQPKAGAKDFDDSGWRVLDPTKLEDRLGEGRVSFVWYRIALTLPSRVGDLSVRGARAVFEIVVDDYAEVWVDGRLDKTFGTSGQQVIRGFNGRNRVVLTDDARPGQTFHIAVLGINGPMADAPSNYIWIRSATLDLYRQQPIPEGWGDVGSIVRVDPRMDSLFAADAKIERIATGFQFGEGPVWHPGGWLLFSDPNANVIYRWEPETWNVSVFLTKSGYTGVDIGRYHQPGSNGLTFDPQGRLVVAQHGNRRVLRHERKGPTTVVADRYRGKRFNSPNDLVYRSDGALFLTDPPYGLPKVFDDPAKELPHSGVYAVIDGKVSLCTKDLKGPNGIAFTPDEKQVYVSNWDITDIHRTKVIRRYDVSKRGQCSKGVTFFHMNHTDDDEALDGLKVDEKGTVYSSAPGGIWIIAADGTYLGKIKTPIRPANLAWGDDGRTLYLTAGADLYRVRTKVRGAGRHWMQ
jgi:gluconolactonase